MTTSTLHDVCRIAALPTCAGFGSAPRFEDPPPPPQPPPPPTLSAELNKATTASTLAARGMRALVLAYEAIDRAETALLGRK